jgi:hypothetical protein
VQYDVASANASVVVNSGEVPSNATFTLTAKNVYDEVLSDKARLSGTLLVRLKGHSESSATIHFTMNDLVTGRLLSGTTLTIQPGQTLILTRPWGHQTDAGLPFWSFLHLTKLVTEKGKEYYRSDDATLEVSGSMQIYDKVQPVVIPPHEFPVVYILFDTISDSTTPACQ